MKMNMIMKIGMMNMKNIKSISNCILNVIIILYLPIKSSKISLKFSEMIGDL